MSAQTQLHIPGNLHPVDDRRIAVIASIYPKELVVRISRRTPISEFRLLAGSRENPFVYAVPETTEMSGTLDNPSVVVIPSIHTALHIVSDLTEKLWGISAALRAWPGVFLCAGSAPTRGEIDDAWQCQQRYYGHLVNAARELVRKKMDAEIRPEMRMAAEELGVVEDWVGLLTAGSRKKCIWCRSLIDNEARVCAVCLREQTEVAVPPAATAPAPIAQQPAQQPPNQQAALTPSQEPAAEVVRDTTMGAGGRGPKPVAVPSKG